MRTGDKEETAAAPEVPPEGHTETGTAPSSQHRPCQLKSIMEALLHTPTLKLARPGTKTSPAALSLQGPITDHHRGPSSAFPLSDQAKPPHSTSPCSLQDSPSSTGRRGAKQGTVFGCGLTSTTKSNSHSSCSCSCCPAWASPCQHRRALQLAQAPCPAGWPKPFLQASSSPLQGTGARWPQLSCSPSLQESRPCSSPATIFSYCQLWQWRGKPIRSIFTLSAQLCSGGAFGSSPSGAWNWPVLQLLP